MRPLFQFETRTIVFRAKQIRFTQRIRQAEALVGVAGGQVSRDFRAFLDIPADRDGSGRRAGPVGLLEPVIAAVEARDHAGAAVAGGGFGVDQRLHLVAPFAAFIGSANAPEEMQGAEDLGQPLQVAVERRSRILGPRRAGKACRDENEGGQKMLGHEPAAYAFSGRWKQAAGGLPIQARSRCLACRMTSERPPVTLRSPIASGSSHLKSSSSSFRTTSPAFQRAANDMIR